MPTHYELLGLPETASPEEVRHAYRRLVKAAHPDAAGDTAQFRLITQAYSVLSDPDRRAAYDRTLRPARVAPLGSGLGQRRPRPHYGRYLVLLVAALVVAGLAWLVVATKAQSVGDRCLVGTWRGEAFAVPFRGSLDGSDVTATITGGAGVILRVASDGTVRADYGNAAPLTGADGAHRIEGVYTGATIERWRAAGGRVRQSATDTSALRLRATIDGREPDQPLQLTVLDGAYPYTCTSTTLDLGPYRYIRS